MRFIFFLETILLKHPEFFFWIVMAIMFLILWRKNGQINKKIIEIKNKSIPGIFQDESGQIHFQRGVSQVVEMLNDVVSETSKVSGLGFILSSVCAVLSAIISIMRNW